MQTIEPEFMAFIGEGREGIGSVMETRRDAIVIFVENAGEFVVPRAAVKAVHDNKVILDPDKLDPALLSATGHRHDREDPRVAG